ncbi:MAG: protein kinase [Deltaproteobacteria bacterium]|nr:protein kinase [Deltaproteobacteria bacterium]
MKLGRYTIEARVGSGGMGAVFRATISGAAGFEKTVAIKRLLPHLTTDKEFIRLFIEEARTLSDLTHPNIVQVLDFERAGGEYLLVMEYVAGHPLSRVLQRCRTLERSVPLGLVVHIAEQTATGLAYAHRKADKTGKPLGIVHRDVSPQNILISSDGLVKVTDFGIAKGSSRGVRTKTGHIRGKLGYISPEQIHGRPADRRSDIFLLGIVMYHMLTGDQLFKSQNDFENLKLIRGWAGLEPDGLPPHVPPELARILCRALEPDPQLRYQTAEDLSSELRSFLASGLGQEAGAQQLALFLAEVFAGDTTDPAPIEIDSGDIIEEETVTLPTESLIHEDLVTQPFPSPFADTKPRTPPGEPSPEEPTYPGTEPSPEEPTRPGKASNPTVPLLRADTEPTRQPRSAGRRILLVLGALVLAASGVWLLVREADGDRHAAPAPGVGVEAGHDAGAGAPDASTPDAGAAPPIAGDPKPALDAPGPNDGADETRAAETSDSGPGDRSPPADRSRERTKRVRRPRRGHGYLVLNSSPWAYVEIDGKRCEKATPIVGLKLPAGKHRVRLLNPVVKRETTIEVRITKGETTRRAVKF